MPTTVVGIFVLFSTPWAKDVDRRDKPGDDKGHNEPKQIGDDRADISGGVQPLQIRNTFIN